MTHNSVSNFKFKETLGHCSARFRDRRSFNNKDGLYFIAAAVVHFLGVHRRREELCKNCFSATFAFKVFFTDSTWHGYTKGVSTVVTVATSN